MSSTNMLAFGWNRIFNTKGVRVNGHPVLSKNSVGGEKESAESSGYVGCLLEVLSLRRYEHYETVPCEANC
jgi:hypothetical protein